MRTVAEVARAEAITTGPQTLGLTQSAVSRAVALPETAARKARPGDRLLELGRALARWRELEITKLAGMHFACMVRKSHPFSQVEHPSESFGGLGRDFLMLRDAVEMPAPYVSYARSPHRPKTNAVAIFEKLLVEDLTQR